MGGYDDEPKQEASAVDEKAVELIELYDTEIMLMNKRIRQLEKEISNHSVSLLYAQDTPRLFKEERHLIPKWLRFGGWWLALFVLLSFSVVRADDTVPFTMSGYNLMIPVHIDSATASVDVVCALDTAATRFWMAPGLQERLKLTSVLPEYKWPPVTVPLLRIGTKTVINQQGYVWATMPRESCIIGLDVFWDTYTTFNFQAGQITTSGNPDYWHAEWEACRQGVCQWWQWWYGYCPWGPR